MKSAVKKNQRNSQEREPDMRAQPALHISDREKRQLLARAEERGKNKNA